MPNRDDLKREFYRKLKALPCIVCGKYGVDAAHITPMGRFMDWTARSHRGPRGYFAVPLCRKHHDAIHRMGEEAFWHEYHIDKAYPYAVALRILAEVVDES